MKDLGGGILCLLWGRSIISRITMEWPKKAPQNSTQLWHTGRKHIVSIRRGTATRRNSTTPYQIVRFHIIAFLLFKFNVPSWQFLGGKPPAWVDYTFLTECGSQHIVSFEDHQEGHNHQEKEHHTLSNCEILYSCNTLLSKSIPIVLSIPTLLFKFNVPIWQILGGKPPGWVDYTFLTECGRKHIVSFEEHKERHNHLDSIAVSLFTNSCKGRRQCCLQPPGEVAPHLKQLWDFVFLVTLLFKVNVPWWQILGGNPPCWVEYTFLRECGRKHIVSFVREEHHQEKQRGQEGDHQKQIDKILQGTKKQEIKE